MKNIVLILIFTLTLFAENFSVEEKLFIDKSKSLSLQQVKEEKEKLFNPINKYNQGVNKSNFWIHLDIKNTLNKPLTKRFFNKRAGVDFIEVFIYKNNQLFKTYKLGDMVEHSERDNIFRVSYFDLSLEPQEGVEVFIKQETFSAMNIEWREVAIDEFDNYYRIQGISYAFISGVLTITSTLSLFLFVILKRRVYLLYSTFTFGTILIQLAFAGFLYEFYTPIYIINIFTYCISTGFSALLGFFPFMFFALKKTEFPYITKLIKILIPIILAFAISFSFYPLNSDLLYNAQYLNFFSLTMFFALFTLSIKIFLAKKEGSLFYLLANLVLVIFISIFLMGIMGLVPHGEIYYYTIAIGTIGQDIFLALAIIQATYMIKEENDRGKGMLEEYSRLSFLGQTFINIYHQWKTPVNNIFNSINHIEVANEFKDENLEKIVNENMQQIKRNTLFLKDTASNFLQHYSDIKQNRSTINLYEEISSVTYLLRSELEKKTIGLDINVDTDLNVIVKKNYFDNLIIIFLENAIKIFEKREIKQPKITIGATLTNGLITLTIEDNGGGIKQSNLEQVFEKDFTLSNSTGIGLYMAKHFLMNQLDGTINVRNTNNGALFEILIPQQ